MEWVAGQWSCWAANLNFSTMSAPDDTVSFKKSFVEQQETKIKLLSAVKSNNYKDARSWLEYLQFCTQMSSASGGKAKDWAALGKQYASALTQLKGT
jgi:hypothetical protein